MTGGSSQSHDVIHHSIYELRWDAKRPLSQRSESHCIDFGEMAMCSPAQICGHIPWRLSAFANRLYKTAQRTLTGRATLVLQEVAIHDVEGQARTRAEGRRGVSQRQFAAQSDPWPGTANRTWPVAGDSARRCGPDQIPAEPNARAGTPQPSQDRSVRPGPAQPKTSSRTERHNMRIAGIVLLAVGILALVYGGFTYTGRPIRPTSALLDFSITEKERVNVPVWVGVAFTVVGAGLLLKGKR